MTFSKKEKISILIVSILLIVATLLLPFSYAYFTDVDSISGGDVDIPKLSCTPSLKSSTNQIIQLQPLFTSEEIKNGATQLYLADSLSAGTYTVEVSVQINADVLLRGFVQADNVEYNNSFVGNEGEYYYYDGIIQNTTKIVLATVVVSSDNPVVMVSSDIIQANAYGLVKMWGVGDNVSYVNSSNGAINLSSFHGYDFTYNVESSQKSGLSVVNLYPFNWTIQGNTNLTTAGKHTVTITYFNTIKINLILNVK